MKIKFICYNGFPTLCDHALDFTKEQYRDNWGLERLHNHEQLNPYLVRSGDLIFVKTDFIVNGLFQRDFLDKICCDFSLVTGNSSYQIGRDGGDSYKRILNDPRLIEWFCINPPDELHGKIVPIPIGFEEPSREGGNQEVLEHFFSNNVPSYKKKEELFLPFHTIETNSQRGQIVNYLSGLPFVTKCNEKKNFKDYMDLLNQHKFIICLEGSGPDIHRAWESLLCGSVPIMKRNVLESVFKYHNLPGIFVDKWEDLDYNKIMYGLYDFTNVQSFLQLSYFDNLFRS